MKTFTANDAKQHFGRVLDASLQAPVSITKHGRPSVVITSSEDYDELMKLKFGRLKEEVQKGFEQLDGGSFSNRTFEEIAEEALKLHAQRNQ